MPSALEKTSETRTCSIHMKVFSDLDKSTFGGDRSQISGLGSEQMGREEVEAVGVELLREGELWVSMGRAQDCRRLWWLFA